MRCSPDDAIKTVKSRLHKMEGIPPDQQRLIHGGHAVDNERTLRDYNIQNVTILPYTCVICSRDGWDGVFVIIQIRS